MRLGDRMPQWHFVTYLRVSTPRQGVSGLGLEAQRYAAEQYVAAVPGRVIAEFVEVESGRKTNRRELAKALAVCRIHGATLVVAKLDRLARNAAFLLALRDSDVDFVCADMPEANRLTIGILAVVAENEAEAISARTRVALAAAKRRGVKLGGNPANLDAEASRRGRLTAHANSRALARQRATALVPIVQELRASGARTVPAIVDGLNARGIMGPRGGRWERGNVRRLLALIDFRPTLEEALKLIRAELRHHGGHRTRNMRMYEDRLAGRTLKSLAAEHGVTAERVRQLCHLEAARRRRMKGPHRRGPRPSAEVDLRNTLEALLMEQP